MGRNVVFEMEQATPGSEETTLIHIETFYKYMAAYVKRRPTKKKVKEIVNKFSTKKVKKKKVLAPEDAHKIFNAIYDKELSRDDCTNICTEVDEDMNGYITEEDLLDYMNGLVLFDQYSDFKK